MTQIELAKKGTITAQMKHVAQVEQLDESIICGSIASGTVVIPANTDHPVKGICGIGKNLRIKVNSNIGTSSDVGTLEGELEKLTVSIQYGADTVMDLSTGGDIRKVRRSILKESSVPIGTVPIYQAMIEAGEKYGPIVMATADDLFQCYRRTGQRRRGFRHRPLRRHTGRNQRTEKSTQGNGYSFARRGISYLAGCFITIKRTRFMSIMTAFWRSPKGTM